MIWPQKLLFAKSSKSICHWTCIQKQASDEVGQWPRVTQAPTSIMEWNMTWRIGYMSKLAHPANEKLYKHLHFVEIFKNEVEYVLIDKYIKCINYFLNRYTVPQACLKQ